MANRFWPNWKIDTCMAPRNVYQKKTSKQGHLNLYIYIYNMSNCFHFIIVLISPLATLSSQAKNSNNFNTFKSNATLTDANELMRFTAILMSCSYACKQSMTLWTDKNARAPWHIDSTKT